MNILYDPDKKTVSYGDRIVSFDCGAELTTEAADLLSLYFGFILPQQAYVAMVDNISRESTLRDELVKLIDKYDIDTGLEKE